jgi:hypothetical protein
VTRSVLLPVTASISVRLTIKQPSQSYQDELTISLRPRFDDPPDSRFVQRRDSPLYIGSTRTILWHFTNADMRLHRKIISKLPARWLMWLDTLPAFEEHFGLVRHKTHLTRWVVPSFIARYQRATAPLPTRFRKNTSAIRKWHFML